MATLQPVSQGPQGSSNDVEMDDFEIDLNMVGTPMMQDNLDLDDDIQEYDADLPDAQDYGHSMPLSPRSVAMENDDVGLSTNPGMVEDISDLPDIEPAEAVDSLNDQPIHYDSHDVIPDVHIGELSEHIDAITDEHDELVDVPTVSTPTGEQHPSEAEQSNVQPQMQEAVIESFATTDTTNDESFPNLEFTANEDAEGLDASQNHEFHDTNEHVSASFQNDSRVEDPKTSASSHGDVHDDIHGSLGIAQLEMTSNANNPPISRTGSPDDVARVEETTSQSEDKNKNQSQAVSDEHDSPRNAGESEQKHSTSPEKRRTGSLHPVLVSWEEQKDWLFQPQSDEDYQGFYLQNPAFALQSYPTLFQALRGALEDAVGHEEEILIEVPVFDVTIHEDSCDENSSLADIVDIFVKLETNDGKQSPEPFEIFLSKRVRFSHRIQQLKNAAASALGRSKCDFLHGTANLDSSDYTDDGNQQSSRQSPIAPTYVDEDRESNEPTADPEDPNNDQGDTQEYDESNVNDAQQAHGEENQNGEFEQDEAFEADEQHEYGDAQNQSEHGNSPQQDYEDASRNQDWQGSTQAPEGVAPELDNVTEHVEVDDATEHVEVMTRQDGNEEKQTESFDPFEAPSILPHPELEIAVNEAFPDTSLDVAHSELDEQFDLTGYGNDFFPGNEDFDESAPAQPEPVNFDGGVTDETQSLLTEPALPVVQEKEEDADKTYALGDDDLIDYDDDDEEDQSPEPVPHPQPSSTSSAATVQGEDVESEKHSTSTSQPQHDASDQSTPNKRNRESSEDVQRDIPDPKRRKSG